MSFPALSFTVSTVRHRVATGSTSDGEAIAPGVHSIGPRQHGYGKGGYARAYLFEHGDELTLVDTLWDDDGHVILHYLSRIGRSPTAMRRIALTHAHRSHLGGLKSLQVLSGAKVYAHAAEVAIIEGRARAHPVSLRPQPPLRLYPFRVGARLAVPRHVPCHVDETLHDGDVVGPLEVLHTPGHTPGHVAFSRLESGQRVLVVGDAVATWPRFDAGWPGFNLDEHAYAESLRRLAGLAPDVIGPGHGDPIATGAADRIASLVAAPRR
jgi:glyoxylase-like metal-dependent hydrolase (beta-lactamase superfamily II)